MKERTSPKENKFRFLRFESKFVGKCDFCLFFRAKKMLDSKEMKEQCSLNPLDSARFIMERAKNVSIDLLALRNLSNKVSCVAN